MLQRSSLSSIQSIQAGVLGRDKRTRPQQALLTIMLLLGIAFALSLYIYQTSKITVVTYDIRDMQTNYARLVRENTNLLAQISYEQSIPQMTRRALTQGFQPIKVMHFLYVNPGTSNRDTPPPTSPSPTTP